MTPMELSLGVFCNWMFSWEYDMYVTVTENHRVGKCERCEKEMKCYISMYSYVGYEIYWCCPLTRVI